ncbi:hypothetical protein Mucpa_1384 [Mucilaginibacter paludis DSM 18603]|uniref:Uncharacterized protein n=1 Tax=Mucilaginibacter paludis DSM 18603 TaxID=714943 RepID=H1YHZ6_9SPHI|nr:hypothetical protein Mucpa_1384 [Mucilaginibacter paludis DSM 18603]
MYYVSVLYRGLQDASLNLFISTSYWHIDFHFRCQFQKNILKKTFGNQLKRLNEKGDVLL